MNRSLHRAFISVGATRQPLPVDGFLPSRMDREGSRPPLVECGTDRHFGCMFILPCYCPSFYWWNRIYHPASFGRNDAAVEFISPQSPDATVAMLARVFRAG